MVLFMYINFKYLMIECLNKVNFFVSIEYGIWFFFFGFFKEGEFKELL